MLHGVSSWARHPAAPAYYVGFAAALPRSHPLRQQVEAIDFPCGSGFILGDVDTAPAWFKLADIKRLTDTEREVRRQKAAEEQDRKDKETQARIDADHERREREARRF
jgi:hypothetical protein